MVGPTSADMMDYIIGCDGRTISQSPPGVTPVPL